MNKFLSDEIYMAAPLTEPERQHYFIARLKDYFSANADGAKAAEPAGGTGCAKAAVPAGGAAPKAAVVTFGCQMNARDSEKLEGILSEIGFEMTDDEAGADFVAFNTCTVRENANEHLYGRLGRLKQSKKADPDKIVSVCGCMMQETDEIEKLKVKYPYVDIIFGTHNLFTFPELLFTMLRKRGGSIDEVYTHGKTVLKSSADDAARLEKLLRYGSGKSNMKDIEKLCRKPVISVWKDSSDIVEKLPSKRKYSFKQGINIMFGCDNFCSYCIVPYVRGREKSRAPEEIYDEIRKCAAEGVKEIMLLGQNVNSYKGISAGADATMSFAELLKNIDDMCDEIGIERVRFMTSHPKDLSDELIEVMAASKHVCHQFHLPMQSGSDPILKRMNRHYDKERFLDRAAKLKAAMPDISISTDIIVGFPGETEEDFRETLDVVKKVRFDSAFTFIYSKREGTPAAGFEDQVSEEEVKDRFDRLLEVQNRIVDENLDRMLGGTYRVLFEEVSEYDPKLITGKLENSITVHVPGDVSLIGSIREVRLTENHRFYFTGELV
ncbi:MAG: tRNA (N6-isopentenyl adenosine(37)-C2)-methylthiotransferase MiaB [Eubacteriales bacterium]|nr:tRNA (N6-isopentenyl adenosine(37)-C2)-methylthiotransferase MiaB [Eubacteriales bacterium]